MEIRRTTPADMDRLMEIFVYARQFMREHGNPNQWTRLNWPPRDLVEKDIASNSSYVCVHDGRIVGTFVLVQGQNVDMDAYYQALTSGAWLDDSPYGVVHRLASDGTVKGVGSFCLDWAAAQCPHLRIDTHVDNTIMQNLLEKKGFIRCGTIGTKPGGYRGVVYEKLP